MTSHGNFIFYSTLGLILFALGILLEINSGVVAARNNFFQQPTAYGSWLLYFGGIVFLIVGYYSLSPFSRIRKNVDRAIQAFMKLFRSQG